MGLEIIRNKVEEIYPEIKKNNKKYWKKYMVHHIDLNKKNNNPLNWAIILKGDHHWYHYKNFNWEDGFCSNCKKETVHLNNRCTVCRKRTWPEGHIPFSKRLHQEVGVNRDREEINRKELLISFLKGYGLTNEIPEPIRA